MSRPVDAVFESVIRDCGLSVVFGGEVREARAAVAELIAAADAVSEQFVALVRLHGEHTCWEMRDRLVAALARVGAA